MAKEVFTRTKPHVNVALLLPAIQAAREASTQTRQQVAQQLQQLGVSPSGAAAFVRGDNVPPGADRQQIIAILIGLLQ